MIKSMHMVGIKSDSDIPLTEKTGDIKITVESKECGFISSTVPVESRSIGLGFVKTIFLDYDKNYQIKHNDSYADCEITKLPIS